MGQCISSAVSESENGEPPKPKILKKNLLEHLIKYTKFTEDEIKEWHAAFMKAVPCGKMTFDIYSELILRTVFRKRHGPEFVDVNIKNLMHHVDLSFRQIDTNSDRIISFREFMIGMSRATKGTIEEKITYAFSLYDIDKDGIVTVAEMREILTLVEKAYGDDGRSKEEIEKFIKFIFDYLDTNHDGVISVNEFIVGVKTQPDLLNYLTGTSDTLASFQINDLTQPQKTARR